MLTRCFYRPGYVISQRTEAVNGEALRRMCNPRRDQGTLDIQVIEELFFGKGIQLLNVFVENLDLFAHMLNKIGTLPTGDDSSRTDAGGEVRFPDSGRLENDTVVVRK